MSHTPNHNEKHDVAHFSHSILVLFQVALLLGVLWAISLVVFMFSHLLGIESYSPNLVLVSFLFLFTLNPFKICYYRARFWLLRVLVSFLESSVSYYCCRNIRAWSVHCDFCSFQFRIFTAPFQHVGFADFWLADQLNSLAVALLDLQFIICFYAHDWHVNNGEYFSLHISYPDYDCMIQQ